MASSTTTSERLRDAYQMFLSPSFLKRRSTFAHVFELGNRKERFTFLLKERAAQLRNYFLSDDRSVEELKNKVWFLTNTNNQYVTLSPLVEGVNDSLLISSRFRFSRNKNISACFVNLNRSLWSWAAYKEQRQLIRIAKSIDANKYKRLSHHYKSNFGAYRSAIKAFKYYNPKALVISNDHVPFYRTLLHAARHCNLPTIYVQHACVADDFPNLGYDLSLLDGQDALQKYSTNGKAVLGKTALVGIGKFDAFANKRVLTNEVARIGIPYSKGADFEKIIALKLAITSNYPQISLTLRSHPSDNRELPAELANAQFSDGKSENVFSFLEQQDLIIADDTSTHLEATLMNVTSWYFKLDTGGTDDIYGFVKNGLVDHKKSVQHIIDDIQVLITHRPAVRQRAKRYYEPMNTPNDGNCIPLIVKEINDFLSDKTSL